MRYLSKTLSEFAHEKMVWISGPRQVGKTTLSREWLKERSGDYISWDLVDDRARILKVGFLESLRGSAVVLDEIHKYPKWKSWLKGIYDKRPSDLEVVVTGSARLNVFRRGGDSLLGRYELLRLHPFSIGELSHGTLVEPPSSWLEIETKPSNELSSLWLQLERRGGFPEPFTKDNSRHHQRWLARRQDQLIHEDLRELSQIRSLASVEQLALLLPERVGSPFSLQSVREILQVAHDTARIWLENLERLYYCFRISPYHQKLTRVLTKEPKLYLWDWSTISDPEARFENMVASHLLKTAHAWTDLGYGQYELHYIRDEAKREVDFVLTNHKKPQVMIECKRNDTRLSQGAFEIGKRLPGVPYIQLVSSPFIDRREGAYRIVSADQFLAALV